MKILNYLLLTLVTLFAISCYDDKGNYDYSELNRIYVAVWPEDADMPSVAMGDTFRLEPILRFAYDSVNVNLEYEWTFGDKIVGTERNLNWIVDTTGRSSMTLRVRDLDNGMTYMGTDLLIINSVYTSGSFDFMVLSERDGKSLFSFVRTLNDDDTGEYYWEIMEDVYGKENGEELGSKPLFIREHIADIAYSEGHVTIFQEGGQGSVDLDGISMKKDINLVESFSGQTYPENFHPVDAELMSWVHLILNEDGKVYSKIKETQELFQSGYYIHTPLMFENKEIRVDQMVNTIRDQLREFTLIHSVGTPEEPENRFLMVHDLKDDWSGVNVAGKVVTLPEPKNNVWPQGFIPLTDLGDNKLINVGYMEINYSAQDAGYGMLLKTATGEYVYQYFEIEREYSGEQFSYVQEGSDEVLKHWSIKAPVPLEDCVFWTIPSRSNPYLFIAYGKDIYFLDVLAPQNGIRHYYTCKANVVVMNGRTYGGKHLMVGLDDGSLLLLNVAGAKNLPDKDKLLWESEPDVNLGKIVDLTLKTGCSLP